MGYLLNKSIVTVETNNQWKYHIRVMNDNFKKIHDVVAIETHVVVLPFGIILEYAIVLNSPIPTNGQSKPMVVVLDLNA